MICVLCDKGLSKVFLGDSMFLTKGIVNANDFGTTVDECSEVDVFSVVLAWLGLAWPVCSKVQITWDGLLQMLRSKIWLLDLFGHGYTQIIS